MAEGKKYRVAITHIALSMGGGERLLINYALALQSKGHEVELFVNQITPEKCFAEAKDGTLKVSLRRRWFSSLIKGPLSFVCIIVSAFFFAFWMVRKFDAFVVDEFDFTALALRMMGGKVIVYCHFPRKGQYLKPKGLLKRIFSEIRDLGEEIEMGIVNRVQVNSLFTQKAFLNSFWLARKMSMMPEIIYPPVSFAKLDAQGSDRSLFPARYFFSLNRYDPTKCLDLAVNAFHKYLQTSNDAEMHLVLAGGISAEHPSNLACFEDLQRLARDRGVRERVMFLRDISDADCITLLTHATALLYTPSREHFGIVPVEAMYLRTPVLARDDGGPTESVVEGQTGWLLSAEPAQWADKMRLLAGDERLRGQMGEAGRKHVVAKFGMEIFTTHVDKALRDIM